MTSKHISMGVVRRSYNVVRKEYKDDMNKTNIMMTNIEVHI